MTHKSHSLRIRGIVGAIIGALLGLFLVTADEGANLLTVSIVSIGLALGGAIVGMSIREAATGAKIGAIIGTVVGPIGGIVVIATKMPSGTGLAVGEIIRVAIIMALGGAAWGGLVGAVLVALVIFVGRMVGIVSDSERIENNQKND